MKPCTIPFSNVEEGRVEPKFSCSNKDMKMQGINFIFLANIFASSYSFIDPGKEMMRCVDRENDVDSCAFRYNLMNLDSYCLNLILRSTFEVMREVMEVGVPEMNIPVLEPVFLGLIDFKFYNLTVQFIDITMKGFKSFKLLDSHLNKTSGYDKKNS